MHAAQLFIVFVCSVGYVNYGVFVVFDINVPSLIQLNEVTKYYNFNTILLFEIL